MKVYVLTEIDLRFVGYSPNTVQVFPTHEAATAEMARMYSEALKKYDTNENDPMNCFDAAGSYAYVGDADYRLDIIECEFDAKGVIGQKRDTIIVNGRALHYECGHSISEIDGSRSDLWDFSADDILTGAIEPNEDIVYWYIQGRFYESPIDATAPILKAPDGKLQLCPGESSVDDIELYDEDFFGKDAEVTVRLHIYDGYAEGDGVRMEYPKLADLTMEQIEEMDDYLGGRIHDSGYIVPDDVLLKYGKVVSFTGIMNTGQSHDADLVRRINVAWIEKKAKFKPIMIALYERDIDEITDADSFLLPEWVDCDAYHNSRVSGDWSEYDDYVFAEMQTNWDKYVANYLMHIADDRDLECILDFVRG